MDNKEEKLHKRIFLKRKDWKILVGIVLMVAFVDEKSGDIFSFYFSVFYKFPIICKHFLNSFSYSFPLSFITGY